MTKQSLLIRDFLSDVEQEYIQAREQHPKMNSAHEAYAIIKEELDEVWDEVKSRTSNPAAMREELVQLAAMALSMAIEVCEPSDPDNDLDNEVER